VARFLARRAESADCESRTHRPVSGTGNSSTTSTKAVNTSNANNSPRAVIFPRTLAALALSCTCACVAQERYDDAQLSAKHYQTKQIEAERRISALEDENRRLRAQLEASDASLAEAGFDTDQIDARLKNLQNILADIGGQPGDVTKFAVDGGYVYRVKDSILFGLGSAEISSDGRRVLAEVAADINSRAHGKLYVRGHTDNLPIVKPETQKRFPRGNLELSAERALEVAAYLERDAKVPTQDLVGMGFGPSEPVAPNDTEANRQTNRRVAILVADDAPAAGSSQK
jgi:flagellar motor protein MotB